MAQAGFHDAITTICEHLWNHFDQNRMLGLERTTSADAALERRLARLKRIGTHVCLVSLDASVKVSRIEEEGRGLSVIAQEFKILAEEVKNLAIEATGDVTAMKQHK